MFTMLHGCRYVNYVYHLINMHDAFCSRTTHCSTIVSINGQMLAGHIDKVHVESLSRQPRPGRGYTLVSLHLYRFNGTSGM